MNSMNLKDYQPLIEVDHLVKYFPVRAGVFKRTATWVQAVDDVSFSIKKGETLGLVGESGCGKTTVGRTILRLIEPTHGNIRFEGRDIRNLKGAELTKIRRNLQIIFQDPYAALNPQMPIGTSISEGLRIHKIGTRQEQQEITIDLLKKVGLNGYHARSYPHEFSGGQRQRIGIARALALRPKFIVADEPVSALDVSIQAQILNLMKELQEEFQLTYLFIAHNLSVVEYISDRVAVMYLGKIVEIARRDELYRNPLHPYTQALLSAIPIPDPARRKKRVILTGDVPSPVNPPSGCRFHPRCPIAVKQCSREEPSLEPLFPDHSVSCWLAGKG
jgi:peptide/nickel transport system ATP-binding protein/oligopeptide transport system ATP-binding protein